jgi:hypothetical protein
MPSTSAAPGIDSPPKYRSWTSAAVVGSVDGPILMARLRRARPWSDDVSSAHGAGDATHLDMTRRQTADILFLLPVATFRFQ